MFQKTSKSVQNQSHVVAQNSIPESDSSVKDEFEKLQEEYKTVSVRKEELEKVKDNQERQLVKYASLYQETKQEKKVIEKKLDDLQKDHINRIETHADEKIKAASQYSRLMIFTTIVAVLLTVVIILYSFPSFFQQ